MGIDANGYPLGFKVSQGSARARAIVGAAGSDVFVTEARQAGYHQKEAIVTEGAGGSAWRLTSDEGAYLKGTDLAPFPLGFFNAGLQSDLAGRLLLVAKARRIAIRGLAVTIRTDYALTGSFVEGTGRGFAEAVHAHAAVDADATESDVKDLVHAAIAASPAFDMIKRPLENSFALYANGQRRNPSRLPASAADAPPDPFVKYKSDPAPLAGSNDLPGLVVKTTGKNKGEPNALGSTPLPGGRVIWSVMGQGEADVAAGTYRCRVALDRPGTTHFAYVTDESGGDRAPSGLALVSAGIAFCYMTQISRYIEAMQLRVRGVRLVQMSPYGIGGDRHGVSEPCDTHLFMQGEADDATFERLQLVAATTCYLHQTMAGVTPLHVSIGRL
jgi:uncharacterized OsmC-like protein